MAKLRLSTWQAGTLSRLFWVAVVFLGSACGSVGWQAVTAPARAIAQDTSPKDAQKEAADLSVRSLTIVDKQGRKRGWVGVHDNDNVVFALNNLSAKPWLRFGASDDQAEFYMQIPGDKDAAGLSLALGTKDETPNLSLWSAGNVTKIGLSTSPRAPLLQLDHVRTMGDLEEAATVAIRVTNKASQMILTPYFNEATPKSELSVPLGSLKLGFGDNKPLTVSRVEQKDSPTWPAR